MEELIGFGLEIGAGDFNLFAEVGGGDALGEFIGGLVKIFGDFLVTLLVFGDLGSYVVGDPDSQVQLEIYIDVGDGDHGVGGIGLARFSGDRCV